MRSIQKFIKTRLPNDNLLYNNYKTTIADELGVDEETDRTADLYAN